VSAEFEGKVALITGGARGIGFSIAETLVREGASVFICGRDPARLKMALGQLHTFGAEASAAGTVADVRRYDDCRTFVQKAATRFGRVDILVNNAGIVFSNPLTASRLRNGMSAFRQTFAVSSIVAAKPFQSCGSKVAATSFSFQACSLSMVLPGAPPTVPLNSA